MQSYFFLSLLVALIPFSCVSLSIFNLLYFSIFSNWILLCSAALHQSIHCIRVKSGSLQRISCIFLLCIPFIICNLLILFYRQCFHRFAVILKCFDNHFKCSFVVIFNCFSICVLNCQTLVNLLTFSS